MAEFVKLNPQEFQQFHEQNPCLMSCNVEFAKGTSDGNVIGCGFLLRHRFPAKLMRSQKF